MKGVNKVILVGHMGKVPETKATQSGDTITTFSVATTEKWTNKQTGQKEERVEWHNCVAFKRLAEIIAQYGNKGQKVYIEGSNRTKKYTDQGGVDHYPTNVAVDEFIIMHDANYNADNSQQSGAPAQRPAAPQPPQPQSRQNPNGTDRSPYAQNAAPPPPINSFDDDIPF